MSSLSISQYYLLGSAGGLLKWHGGAYLKDLGKLDITNCKITDSGLEHLKDSKNLKSLELQLTPVTDIGLQHLHGLKKLESLDLRETKVTPRGVADLQKALPNCKISSDFETKPPATKAP
ncbi:MAG: hypothetical protein K0U86_09530 [Planctomycetes bacterium]|nr:hypothetical protein [Planctomycetota bacterium]MCH9725131.1 hypothetical protein [Planctomycetota bacterium]MCH9774907.1 hypothetical protein [Planctomycetota bacterium]MCH9791791.1 hypothetical protein [Planctomycetota bacterium]